MGDKALCIRFNRDAKDRSRTLDYFLNIRIVIKIKAERCSKSRAKRPGQKPDARCCGNERKRRKLELNRFCRGSLSDNDVECSRFHCRIPHFFYYFIQAVRFVDKKNIVRHKVCENRSKVAHTLDRRTRRGANVRVHFPRDEICKRGLPKPRGAIQKHVFNRLTPVFSRLDKDLEIVLDVFLSDILIPVLWA